MTLNFYEKKNKLIVDLVSIIMPAYNCEDFIEDSIKSIQSQYYNRWELIVINDCSIDRTESIVSELMINDDRIKLINLEKNSGAAIARNTGIKYAKGQYIAFLDSDDLWFPHKLAVQISTMKENNFSFTCTSYNKIDQEGKSLNRIIKSKPKSSYNNLLHTCPGNSTVVYDAQALGKFFIDNIKKRNDYVMWLKVIKEANYLYGIDEVLSSHRIRTDSISSNKFSLVHYHWIVYRDIEELSFFRSIYLVCFWIIVTVLKLR